MFGNFGVTEILLILLVVALIFGTKKVRSIGSDLGSALRGFKKSLSGEDGEQGSDADKKDDSKPDKPK